MMAANRLPAAPPLRDQPLFDAPMTERDWLARALANLQRNCAHLRGMSLDEVLAHPGHGRVVRGYAAQLRVTAAKKEEDAAKAAKYGRRVFPSPPFHVRRP